MKAEVMIGLDMASWKSGFCVMKLDVNGKLKRVQSGTIICKDKKATIDQRLTFFRKNLEKLIDTYNPQMIVLEDIFLSKGRRSKGGGNVKTFKVLAMLHGVILQLLHEKQMRYEYYAPTTIKATICSGRASKEEMMEAIAKKLKVSVDSFIDDNETDAIGIALTYGVKQQNRLRDLLKGKLK